MKIFNEETIAKNGQKCIILIDKKEAAILIDILEFASKEKPRKKTWSKLYNLFYNFLAIF
jgi:hypothetical protein